MEHTRNTKNYFSSENENIEMFACFPWSRMNGISSTKGNGKMKRNRALSNSNKDVLGICFITDLDGYFKYIHPNFLNLFEGVENQFYEASVLDMDVTLDSPSILKYLVAMIQQNTPNSFLKNRFSKYINKFHKLEWKMVYNRGLLYFSLAEEAVVSTQDTSEINPEFSPEQILSKEIKKLYWKIEHAKMFHTIQISTKKQIENKDFDEPL
ncbi:MAG: hypothetical protein ACQEQB_05735 [Bacteroidota bacterium]